MLYVWHISIEYTQRMTSSIYSEYTVKYTTCIMCSIFTEYTLRILVVRFAMPRRTNRGANSAKVNRSMPVDVPRWPLLPPRAAPLEVGHFSVKFPSLISQNEVQEVCVTI
jgi:hypothetical protein